MIVGILAKSTGNGVNVNENEKPKFQKWTKMNKQLKVTKLKI